MAYKPVRLAMTELEKGVRMSNINLTKQQTDKITEESVKEYLARGGKITVCEPGARTENIQVGQWTRNRRRGPSKSPPGAEE
jgi:predicted peroxiredoxin